MAQANIQAKVEARMVESPDNAGSDIQLFKELDAPAAMPSIQNSETYKANRKFILDRLRSITSDFVPFGTPNLLNDRYEIDVTKELPHLSKNHAKAYLVMDKLNPSHQCFAYVTEPYHPVRMEGIDKLRGLHHPHLIELLDAGVVYLESMNANRFILVYEQPLGESLARFLERGEAFKLTDALKKLLIPVASVLQRLAGQELVYGCLNPHNIFVHEEKIMLGDCIAEPVGLNQPLVYEPLEYLLAGTDGRGAGSIATDMYALGVLVLDACNELGVKKQLKKEQLLSLFFSRGAYTLFVNESLMPGHLIDFFRGTLLEKASERWTIEQLVQYAGGKRYNLIMPNPPRDSARSHEFSGIDHYALSTLAHSYQQNWENALADIKNRKLVKWLETLSFKSEVKERIESIQSRASRVGGRGGAADDLIARSIIALDPQGPIRLKQFAVHPDNAPYLFCRIVSEGNLQLQSSLQQVFNHELVSYWRDASEDNYRKISWDPNAILSYFKSSAVGFGVERVIYELNPRSPCLSRDYLRYYITSAKSMLLLMDSLARDKMEDSLLDRHLIAFLAARSGVKKEVKLTEYKLYPQLLEHKEFQALVIMARAQEKSKIASLPGLCHWAGMRMLDIIEQFHSREARNAFSRDLQTVLGKGKLSYIVQILQNQDYINKDYNGHQRAIESYHKNSIKILKLKDKNAISRKAQEQGLRTAFMIGGTILFCVSYYLLNKYAF